VNLLAVGAHPDDIEFGCAPVLIKELRKGNRVRMLVLSRGEAGSAGTPELREQEARTAAARIGAEIEFLEMGGDCHLEYRPANSLRLAAEIRQFRPAIVLAPHPEENQHPDHAVAARLMRDACRLARYGGLEELRAWPVHKIASLYFYNITSHLGHTPDIVIGIADAMEEWEAVMNCHGSQVLSKGYIELQKSAARLLGLATGTEYAAGLYANDPVRVDHLSDLALSSRNF
jgi:LmbE family N-acetylglucosaminyl deacetylase